MTHIRVETRAPSHRKVLALSDAAFRLWISATCRARDVGGDGDIVRLDLDVIPRCPPSGRKRNEVIAELVSAGLWEPTETGWRIHDYADWQDSQTTVESRRAEARERMRTLRDVRKSVRANIVRTEPERSPNVRTVFDDGSQNVRSGSGSGSGSGSDLEPQISRPDRSPRAHEPGPSAAAPSQESSRKQPVSLDEAMAIPLAERAELVVSGGVDAQWSAPHQWPETVAIATAVARHSGHPAPRLGAYHRDAGVRAVVGLFADGWSADELLAALPAVLGSEWWRRERRGLAALTPEVLRRAVQADPSQRVDPGPPAVQDARIAARRAREADEDRRALEARQRAADAALGVSTPVRDLDALIGGIG